MGDTGPSSITAKSKLITLTILILPIGVVGALVQFEFLFRVHQMNAEPRAAYSAIHCPDALTALQAKIPDFFLYINAHAKQHIVVCVACSIGHFCLPSLQQLCVSLP